MTAVWHTACLPSSAPTFSTCTHHAACYNQGLSDELSGLVGPVFTVWDSSDMPGMLGDHLGMVGSHRATGDISAT